MNEPSTVDVSKPASASEIIPRSQPRLRFPLLCVLIFWVLTFGVGPLDKPYFFGFMFGLISTGLLTLLFLGWWWFNRAFRFPEKLLGFLFVLGEAVLVGRFAHPSVSPFTLWLGGFPLIATFIIGWLFVVNRLRISLTRLGFALGVTLVWSYFLLIRLDGADSRLKFKTHWRWTPTAEDRFLASSPASAASKLSSTTASTPSQASETDWTSFRGPDRDGVIRRTTISTNWTINPPALVWKHPVGPAWSSLLVVGNRLFTQEQRGDKETVVCYAAGTGETVWVHEDTARFDEQVSGPGPRSTPTFASGRLYALGGTGLLNCLDAGTGASLWHCDIKDASGAKVPTWAFSSSPLVASNLVIVYAGGEGGKGLLAYRSDSGQLAWSCAAGGSSYSSPQLTSISSVPQCLMVHDSGLTSVDINTGKKLWETGLAMKGAPRTGQPRLINDNKLLVGTLGGLGCSLIEVSTNGNDWSISTKWDSKALKPEFPDLVVYKSYAYGFDVGIFCCLNLADGKRMWKEGRYGRGEVMLLPAQDALLVSSETGELILLAADPNSHRELGRFQALEGKTWNHPVVIRNRVYLRNAQEMACYLLSDKVPVASRLTSE